MPETAPIESSCACGCGQLIAKNQLWSPGHDHRAVQGRIKRDFGSVAAFIEWYDRVRAKREAAAATRKTNRESTAGARKRDRIDATLAR